MSKLSSQPSHKALLLGSVLLVMVGALIVRFLPTTSRIPAPVPAKTAPVTTPAPVGVPEFTSAAFQTGDSLAGLGPEWTFLRQDDLSGVANAKIPKGTSGVRETLVKLSDASSTMLLTELKIDDAKALEKALSVKAVVARTIAGRKGYVLPVASMTGGSAFMISGTSTALMLEYGEDPYGNLMDWPKTVPAAIASFIATVKVD